MACFSCLRHGLSPVFKSLSRAAAKSAKAKLRATGLMRVHPDVETREAVCRRCPMRQVYGGVSYCGSPLLRKVQRDPVMEGCGCPIADKAADPSEHCPITITFDRPHRAGEACDCRWCVAAQRKAPG